MPQFYKDYFWKKGIPFGTSFCHNPQGSSTYKVIADPYKKWISIEKYNNEKLDSIIYDSQLFDFRSLSTINQTAWQKEKIKESENTLHCVIRNQDDRIILFENYTFKNGICRECTTTSAHGILVSFQKIYHQDLGDSYNGVILFDANQHPVVKKQYQLDSESKTFTQLLNEEWNGHKISF